jgi:hypothetical protein
MSRKKNAKGLVVKTKIKAGGQMQNHSEKLVKAAPKKAKSLVVKTKIKAGGITMNHSEKLVRV